MRFKRSGLSLIVLQIMAMALVGLGLIASASRAEAQTYTPIYNFCSVGSCSDGAGPNSQLTADAAGNLYGTTYSGGGNGAGVVFELSPNGGGGYKETVLYNFCSQQNCTDGSHPNYSNVIFDSKGNLYGTTTYGGSDGVGTVYELTPTHPGWKETVLYSFTCGTDGCGPSGNIAMDANGNLCGSTSAAANDLAVVFQLAPSGGTWKESVIYSYAFSKANPFGGVMLDAKGNVYGYTNSTVFELTPNGSGGWNETTLHTFKGGLKDGLQPYGVPVFDGAGNLYGTTNSGGKKNTGTVWRLTPGTKSWKEKVLYSFGNTSSSGWNPGAGVALDSAGNIYGTTLMGGKNGAGVVFELVLTGTRYKGKVLWNFTSTSGASPRSAAILAGGTLYGTAYEGGANSTGGVVYEVVP